MGADEGGLMKYLRFWQKRALKVTTKDLLRALIVRRTLRKPRPDHYRCDEGPYWAGLCRLCSQLCPCAPDWATSPLPLCPIVPGTEHQFYTELIAQQRLCVMGKIAPHPTLPKTLAHSLLLLSISGIVLFSSSISVVIWQGDESLLFFGLYDHFR